MNNVYRYQYVQNITGRKHPDGIYLIIVLPSPNGPNISLYERTRHDGTKKVKGHRKLFSVFRGERAKGRRRWGGEEVGVGHTKKEKRKRRSL